MLLERKMKAQGAPFSPYSSLPLPLLLTTLDPCRYVLQNHALFLIAEQPPADMAALLALFRSSVPPVVKRRARELLNVIKDSVKRGMVVSRMSGQGSADERPESLVPQAEEKRQDVVMLETEMKNLEKDETLSTSIWGQGKPLSPSPMR